MKLIPDMIDLSGAVDVHVHSHPSLFPRIADDRDIVRAAAQAGFGGMMIKEHHESTASRAYFLGREFPGFRVFGGVTLNRHVGGINPAAVEAALRLGAKQVWMPSYMSRYHIQVHGMAGYDVQETGGRAEAKEKGISPVDENDLLTDAAAEVLALIAEHDAILGTSHCSPAEIRVLVHAARDLGVNKILITHPFFKVPNLDLAALEELTGLGAVAEFAYSTVSPMWGYAGMEQVAHAVRTLGAAHCVIMSDAGQRHNPLPHESLRVFAQGLYEKGVPAADLRVMTVDNPRRLLDF